MLRRHLTALLLTFVGAAPAVADVPRVAVDIPPVHGLVSMVMDGVGEPDLLMRPGASPHGYAMRPSEARALQRADAVVWIGPELTPWLERPMSSLAGGAVDLPLLNHPVTRVLDIRDALEAGPPSENEGHGDHDGHSLDDHDHDHHDHGSLDPHAWLDPANAKAWLPLVAELLSGLDPENADVYAENARRAVAQLEMISRDTELLLASMQTRKYVGFHDSLHYFEARYGLQTAGTLALSDAQDPSPARMARMKTELAGSGISCAFSEPQFDPGLLEVALETAEIPIVEIDPVGRDFALGSDFYPELIRSVAASFARCADAK
ncbi:zinc ABC transporter substrate-binding protein [Primorskyibacter sp. S87]|uniref:zinc ABC transporter substrate-binding protein n=1 Tax=Primorskyibacter sp. S87 TaxID=3415126 RepID=UPI003C7ADF15